MNFVMFYYKVFMSIIKLFYCVLCFILEFCISNVEHAFNSWVNKYFPLTREEKIIR